MKSNFKGTGSMAKFCEETNSLFSAVDNIKFIMPSGYSGAEPSIKVIESTDGSSIVFDFGDALIFTTKNIIWNLTGTAAYVSKSVSVNNGRLVINVTANDIP